MQVEVRWLDLRNGTSGVERFGITESEARVMIAKLADKRRAARRPDGSYPPIIHGIRRNPPTVNEQ